MKAESEEYVNYLENDIAILNETIRKPDKSIILKYGNAKRRQHV